MSKIRSRLLRAAVFAAPAVLAALTADVENGPTIDLCLAADLSSCQPSGPASCSC